MLNDEKEIGHTELQLYTDLMILNNSILEGAAMFLGVIFSKDEQELKNYLKNYLKNTKTIIL